MSNDFEFIRVDSFMDDINREDCFDTRDMDGVTPNYRFLLCSSCPSDIDECLDEDGTLVDSVEIITTDGVDDGKCSMQWGRGINGERTMSVADSTVTYDLGDYSANLKAIFLVNIANGSGYVIAYCIRDDTIPIDGELILPTDGMIWTFKYGG